MGGRAGDACRAPAAGCGSAGAQAAPLHDAWHLRSLKVVLFRGCGEVERLAVDVGKQRKRVHPCEAIYRECLFCSSVSSFRCSCTTPSVYFRSVMHARFQAAEEQQRDDGAATLSLLGMAERLSRMDAAKLFYQALGGHGASVH